MRIPFPASPSIFVLWILCLLCSSPSAWSCPEKGKEQPLPLSAGFPLVKHAAPGQISGFFYPSYNDQIINYENRWLWLRSSFSNNVVKHLCFYLPPGLSRTLQRDVHFEEMQPAAMWSSHLNQRRAVTAGMPMTQG